MASAKETKKDVIKKDKKLKTSYRKAIFDGIEISPKGLAIKKEIAVEDLAYGFYFKCKTDSETKIAKVNVEVYIVLKAELENLPEKEPTTLCTVKSFHEFHISNLSEVSKIEKNKDVKLNSAPLQIILAMAVSTTRGMVCVAASDTVFANAVVPILDFGNLIPAQNQE